MTAFATLRELAKRPDPVERCELCGQVVGPRHRHLVEPLSRRLVCACQPCSLLFLNDGKTKYKNVPLDARELCDFHMTDAQWESLLIPIGLAFFIKSSAQDRVLALYPSPAGATESLLSLETWTDIEADNPPLAELQSDVEALLVNRLGERPRYYLSPIDRCYELVGLIRGHWHGLSGGDVMWAEVKIFFEGLTESALA